jgi:ectoine hydroxylase-related dioxygenase (phytanoyl-CoA dioxygenase family)
MYTQHYRIRDAHKGNPERTVIVHATPDEIAQFVRDGFLVRKQAVSSEQVQKLRDAVDEVAERERNFASSWGVFLRQLLDKHPAFLEMLTFEPTLSVARALLGPSVQFRNFTARISYPEASTPQETTWHFHQRLIPDPIPPFFSRPQTIDCLLYLDPANEANGPLCVIPGSHQWMERDLSDGITEDWEGQIVLQPEAGDIVMVHGATWHRAMPTRPDGTVRRLLILGYSPTWMQRSIFGEKPENALADPLRQSDDPEIRELLGLDGYY